MTKILKLLFFNKVIKWIVIPIALLFLWFFLSLVYSSYKSFSILQYMHIQKSNNLVSENKILKGEILSGKFKAQENNLGIISVRFGAVPKVEYENEDVLIFRIKDVNQKDWFYENVYMSGSIKSNEYFPFGFIPVTDSKGKNYEFQLESLNGSAFNAAETRGRDVVFMSKYKFTRDEIFKDRNSLTAFMYKKIFTFLTNYDVLISSSIFLLPFLFYVSLTLIYNYINYSGKRKGKKAIRLEVFAILVSTLILGDLFLIEDLIMGFLLGLLGFWIIAVYLNKFRIYITIILTFIILLLAVAGTYFEWGISINKASTYAYLLIVLVAVQSLIGERKIITKKSSYL